MNALASPTALSRPSSAALLLPALLAALLRLLPSGLPGWGSPLLLLALAALARLLWRLPQQPAGWRELAAFAAAMLAVALPGASTAWLALPCLALLALPAAPLAALLLLALGADGLSHGLAGQLLLAPVLAAEAWVTAGLATLFGTPAVADGAAVLLEGQRVMLLLRGCSAFSLALPTLLGALALPVLLRGATRPAWPPVLGALGLMLLLNLARLLAMALSPALHAWLHLPAGATLLEVIFALPPLLTLVPRPCPAGR